MDGNKILYYCDEYHHEDNCHSWLIIESEDVNNNTNTKLIAKDFNHNHSANISKVEKIKAKTILINKVKESANLYNFNIDKELKKLKSESSNSSQFPEKHSIYSCIYRHINKGLPKNISKIDEIQEDSAYLLTKDQLKFLALKKEKFVLFMFEYQTKILIENHNDLFSDGTFRIASPPFYQCFIIRCAYNNHHKIFTTCFCLLLDKEEETYISCLNSINEICKKYINDNNLKTRFKPKRIHTDFEKAIMNAWHLVFPDIEIKCCKFHLWTLWETKKKSFEKEFKLNDNIRLIYKQLKTLMIFHQNS